jgi:hypothetical protein
MTRVIDLKDQPGSTSIFKKIFLFLFFSGVCFAFLFIGLSQFHVLGHVFDLLI